MKNTLILQAYNINFLYVLVSYIKQGASQKVTFRNNARKKFRDELKEYLTENFIFYEVNSIDSIQLNTFLKENYMQLKGKMYRPSEWNLSILNAFEKYEAYNLPSASTFENVSSYSL